MRTQYRKGDKVICVNDLVDDLYGLYGTVVSDALYPSDLLVDFGYERRYVSPYSLRLDDGRGEISGTHPDPESLVEEFVVIEESWKKARILTRSELEAEWVIGLDLSRFELKQAEYDPESGCWFVRVE